MLRRIPLLLPLALASSAASCGVGGEEPTAQRVVLITCDTLRVDHLGTYGAPEGASPALDALAAKSLVFDRAYSSAPLTAPALSTLMTGRFPDELGMESNKVLLPEDARTLAEVVSAAGIETHAIVSNWVLRAREDRSSGLTQGFDTYDDRYDAREPNRPKVLERKAKSTTNAALAWLATRDGERFFLWVHYQDPHGPYTPPAPYVQWAPQPGEPSLPIGTTQVGLGEIPQYQAVDGEARASFYRARYEGEIRYFDHEVGRLLDALSGEPDTLVVFSADHGESLGEHDYWFTHGQSLYAELVHVPLFIQLPGGARAGRVDRLVGHMDLLATIVSALGLSVPLQHGVDLLAPAGPQDGGAARVVPSQLRASGAADRWESLTDGRYRLTASPSGTWLFDLDADPGELDDVLDQHREIAKRLVEEARKMAEGVPSLAGRAQAEVLSEEEQSLLRAIGYGGAK